MPADRPGDDDVIIMALRADPASCSVVRQRVRRWLAALRWPADEVDDIVMATDEAVSSAIEHALAFAVAGEVRVAGRPFPDGGGRRVIVGVAGDPGWQPEPTEPDLRPLGLMMMLHTCMDAVETSSDESFTTVVMTSVRVPPLP